MFSLFTLNTDIDAKKQKLELFNYIVAFFFSFHIEYWICYNMWDIYANAYRGAIEMYKTLT